MDSVFIDSVQFGAYIDMQRKWIIKSISLFPDLQPVHNIVFFNLSDKEIILRCFFAFVTEDVQIYETEVLVFHFSWRIFKIPVGIKTFQANSDWKKYFSKKNRNFICSNFN